MFADLGLADAAERQVKLRLAHVLNQVLAERTLSQEHAAKVLGVTRPNVSALRHYNLAGFSVERLMELLTVLGRDIEIVVRRKPRARKAGRISVVAAGLRARAPSSAGMAGVRRAKRVHRIEVAAKMHEEFISGSNDRTA